MTYFGGKGQDGVYQTIINQIPEHKVYIEPFLGGGAIMLKKKPALINIGIDLAVESLLAFPPRLNLLLIKQSFFDYLGSIKVENGCAISVDGSSEDIFAFTGSIDRYRTAEKTYSGRDVFIYCDPPYLHRNRGKTRYKFEMTDDDHIKLLNILKRLGSAIAISTYPNELYSEMLNDWRMLEYNSTDRTGTVRTENLFMNYPEPVFLHDDRYVGKNACERQGIKRRIERTKKRILNWKPQERQKLLRKILSNLSNEEYDNLISSRDE